MASVAPPVDERTVADVARQTRELLVAYVPAWAAGLDPGDRVREALVAIFARFAEIVIERLNQAPDKNLLAFVDLLGAAQLPPRPARVPLTFSLATGSAVDAVVPNGTAAAAPPAEGEKEPTVFETERDLVVTATQLVSVFSRDPAHDTWGDRTALVTAPSDSGVPAFSGDQPLEHSLYIGSDALFGYAALSQITLSFAIEPLPADPDPRVVQWEAWDGAQGTPLTPSSDGTAALTTSGQVVFDFAEPPTLPQMAVGSVEGRWLRGRLATPITPSADRQTGMVRAGHLPLVTGVTVRVAAGGLSLPVDKAFANTTPVDPTKAFFPFGEKPKLGDTVYVGQGQALAVGGATVTGHVELVNGTDTSRPPIPQVSPAGLPELQWEYWDGKAWVALGVGVTRLDSQTAGFTDTTRAFTKSGVVQFALPARAAAKTTVNGVDGLWLRVRLTSGDYGKEAHFEPSGDPPPAPAFKFVLTTFTPPLIKSITIDHQVSRSESAPSIITGNDFDYLVRSPTAGFQPLEATAEPAPTLYFGFAPPNGRPFPNRPLNLYARVADVLWGETPDNPSPTAPPRLTWEYSTGQAWAALAVRDGTRALTRPEVIEFLPPPDISVRAEFGVSRYWLRARWDSGDYAFAPRLRRVLLNTTMAAQTVTIRTETLGSSNGSENQVFHATRVPVLLGQQLEVREPDVPSAAGRAAIEAAEGADAVTVARAGGGSPDVWVRWHEVPDFHGSGPQDRHYVIDHLAGMVRFGDGAGGWIPPAGSGNVRLARYQTGGGVRGNRPAGVVVQLKTTVPFVDKVSNPEAASGGADAETPDALRDRAPRMVRHRGRAVTLEDYEDLARLASPDVARVKCVPLHDLETPAGAALVRAGTVSVIIVPRSPNAQPTPGIELLERVRDYLVQYAIPTTDILAVGPEYICVDVDVEIALESLDDAGDVEAAVQQALSRFLHPLTGGLDGTGWDFGRRPHDSDFYVLLESVPGVDHVRSLDIKPRAAFDTDRFLVCSGAHHVTLRYEPLDG